MAQLTSSHHKDEDAPDTLNMFSGISKASVLQAVRIFNDPQIDVKKCGQLITKLLYILGQGDKFTRSEATNIFFAVTKLFQSKDEKLRRMVYLIVKELTPSETEVIMVTSSLTKDMTSTNDLYRANAIRVLCSITDAAMLAQIERHLKQSIVDKQPFVSSAALVSGLHLMKKAPEVVKRWVNEVNQVVADKRGPMVQYHALALLYAIKQTDRLAVSKLVSTLVKQQLRSPLAQCLLLRFTAQVIKDNPEQGRQHYEFLESCLRYTNEMVCCEAARTICELPNVTAREIAPVVSVLQLLLTSMKPTLRFYAVRTLNRVAMLQPLSVMPCNLDLESMITDSNRSIATLAITTLLKTGNEASVERLMRQITTFMSDISDEFKVVVVDAIRALCLKYPAKHRNLMVFLSNTLREEGGFDFKKCIVDSIIAIINNIPEAKEYGLYILCEFIEDCEYTFLCTQILYLLSREGPHTTCPSKYIRFIYNRVILENATVRAAAVSALTQFAVNVPALRNQIVMLLTRCTVDTDDEVRDRATFNLSVLNKIESTSLAKYVTDAHEFPVDGLEKALGDYRSAGNFGAPIDFARIIALQTQQLAKQAAAAKSAASSGEASHGGDSSNAPAAAPSSSGGSGGASASVATSMYKSMLSAVPALAGLGNLFKSSAPVDLTESESEYLVTCVKHIFPQHVVLQFSVTNTLDDMVLANATVQLDAAAVDGAEFAFAVPAAEVRAGSPAVTYVAFDWDGENFPTGDMTCTLNFTLKEVIDAATGELDDGGIEDEYQLEGISLTAGDFIRTSDLQDFRKTWEATTTDFEANLAFVIPGMKGLQQAVQSIMDVTGLAAADKTETVAASAKSHRLLLQGVYLGNHKGLAIADLALSSGGQVEMKLVVRAESELVSQTITSAMS